VWTINSNGMSLVRCVGVLLVCCVSVALMHGVGVAPMNSADVVLMNSVDVVVLVTAFVTVLVTSLATATVITTFAATNYNADGSVDGIVGVGASGRGDALVGVVKELGCHGVVRGPPTVCASSLRCATWQIIHSSRSRVRVLQFPFIQ
jgi:hypothetical protein